ncbi:MAG: hypothetical protein GY699_04505 [Desulfobacteraceae bacterium]|nr:hypothetical protein [Desulfobacteraceae bacterium]
METSRTKKYQNIKVITFGLLLVGGMYAIFRLYIISLFKLSKIAAGSNTVPIFRIGMIICLSILILSVSSSIIRDWLYKKQGRVIVHNARRTWRITWIIGGLLSLLAWIVDHHILFINWYFLAVGLIPLFNSLFKYAEIDKVGLTVFHGIFFRRKRAFFDWSKISDIKLETVKKVGSVSGGGRVWVTVKEEYEEEIFKIVLSAPLTSQEIKNLQKDDRNNIFVDGYSINEKGDEIVLNTEPEGGFEGLLGNISKFKQLKDTEIYPQRSVSYYFLETTAVLVFFAIMIMQVFAFLVRFPQ